MKTPTGGGGLPLDQLLQLWLQLQRSCCWPEDVPGLKLRSRASNAGRLLGQGRSSSRRPVASRLWALLGWQGTNPPRTCKASTLGMLRLVSLLVLLATLLSHPSSTPLSRSSMPLTSSSHLFL